MPHRTTLDGFFHGALELEQPLPGEGYRANVDALHLARFAAQVRPHAQRAVDLGAGVGTVALAYAHLAEARALVLVEREPFACELARRNVDRAGRRDMSHVVERDVDEIQRSDVEGAADLVLANPPYTIPRGGRPSKHARIEAARHGEFRPFLNAMARLLDEGGGVGCLCYPAHAIVDLLSAASTAGLQPARIQLVHADAARPARIALLAMSRAVELAQEVQVGPPVHDRDG